MFTQFTLFQEVIFSCSLIDTARSFFIYFLCVHFRDTRCIFKHKFLVLKPFYIKKGKKGKKPTHIEGKQGFGSRERVRVICKMRVAENK